MPQANTPIPPRFRAVRTHVVDGRTESRLEELTLDDLSPGEVVIRNRYAGVNFKDCLSLHGKAKIITGFPRVAGIELVGDVLHSDAAAFAPGQTVLVHGFQTGIAFDGGFSEIVRVPAAHVQALPAGLTALECAALGVPAFTAAMALERFQMEGLRPDSGPVAITGAGGAVALSALGILARTGHRATAITRRMEQAEALRAAGASEVLDATQILAAPPRALEKPQFAAAIDNVGGPLLSWLLRSTQDQGCVACVGNAASNGFDGSVLPFIMRAIKLVGIVANAPWEQRHRLWARLGSDWKPDFDRLSPQLGFIGLDELLPFSEAQLAGRNSGRALLRFEGA
ncbi:YhdH/YhfP family quinone oxidoreductase [Hydrogenophaga sp. PML113]|uniref:YhdH/YhfP family quinone oxidoreductase n=1 Tax=Hydrogenophaga sp. PML113 TaxID=1899350 RepID=UPI000878D5D9|nr:YhdH/YhfP family quinone oxidoreductase [Hydrogenophaga sp. PML113]